MTTPEKERVQQQSKIVSGGSSQSSWVDKVQQNLSSKEKDRGKDSYCKGKSVWDNVDISKIANVGFKLEYINHECYNNQKIGEIDMGDISSEIEYQQNAIVCYVLGAHPPFLVINSFIQRMW